MSKQEKDSEGSGLEVELERPIWARADSFPLADEGCGWIDRRGAKHRCACMDELSRVIRDDSKGLIHLVWTAESKFCQIPEEVEAFTEAISVVRRRWAADDLVDAVRRLRLLGGGLFVLLCYVGFVGWRHVEAVASPMEELSLVFVAMSSSVLVGVGVLIFLIFAFIPWYQRQKRVKEMRRPAGLNAPLIPLLRFEAWLHDQKSPVTWVILGMIIVVFLGQLVFKNAIGAAGLVKANYLGGEYWRLLTAPMMHGNLLHLGMNGMGFLYLGKRVEVFARWPHVPMVFLFSALVGGRASVWFVEASSVGASGGLMGLLGFLLVFETLHSRLVPRSARRRLVGGVLMTGLIGLVGYRFIDNAAHLGGLLAGMGYAGGVFLKSSSVLRPRVTLPDFLVGGACLAVIAGSGVLTVMKMAGR